MSPTQMLYHVATGCEIPDAPGRCWLCGGPAFDPTPRSEWVRDTFMDHDRVAAPESDVICAACVWATSDHNVELQQLTGKDKPQRMRNYSHVVADGRWIPLTKGQKREMAELLLSPHGLPELAVISESGQKHLIFKARVNAPGQPAGWVLFEETAI